MDEKELIKISQSPEFLSDLSKINRWELLPHLFRVKGKPYSLKGREQFSVLFDNEFVREKIVLSGRQEGKCCQISKNNLRNCYLSKITNPKIGDSVLSFDGWKVRPALITNVFETVKKPILHIVTEKGNELYVSPEHKIRKIEGFVQASELSIGSRIVSMRRGGVFDNFKPESGRIEATAYMIGDGSCRYNMNFTSMCQFCLDEMCKISGKETYKLYQKKGSCAFSLEFKRKSRIRSWMKEDGLYGKLSYEKYIPDWVYHLSREDTILFISRLWATDGRVSADKIGRYDISYCTTSKELSDGVRALLFKLGYMNSVRIKKTHYKKPDGTRVRCRDAYIIRIETFESQTAFNTEVSVPGRPPKPAKDTYRNSNRDTLPKECNVLIRSLFKDIGRSRDGNSLYANGLRTTLKYPPSRSKVEQYLNHARCLGLTERPEYRELEALHTGDAYFDSVKSIEELPEEECIDIEVAEHHNFILDNICVHNSMSLSRSAAFDLLSIPNFQILYVAPLQEQARRFSDLYLNEAFKSCPLIQHLQRSEMTGVLSDAKIINATFHKTIANGSGIQLGYAQTSADRLRGIMCDALLVDEAQSVCADAVPIVQESLTSSEYGTTTYTGTAMVVENFIESKWQKSSMCEWVMKCEGCGVHNIPNLDGHVLSMIQADGMHCYHCGKKLNVRNGQWVAAYPNRMKSFRGYHIPQVVCPFIVENQNNWDKLLHKLMNGVLATFIQENLGISYSVGQRLLTQADIVKQCCLPDTKYLQEHLDRYSFTVAGIDWGGSELQSFTVITVIGVRPDGRLDVLWWKRYRGFDPDDQLVDIAKIVRFYNCQICLDAESLVLTKTPLTSPCYKRIVDVETTDWVWDGHEWVQHEGVKLMKYVSKEDLIELGNTRLTRDHKVYVDDSTSRRADTLQGEGRASALAWRRSASPVSCWHDVWLLAVALGRACTRFVRTAARKAQGKEKG